MINALSFLSFVFAAATLVSFFWNTVGHSRWKLSLGLLIVTCSLITVAIYLGS